MGKKLTVEISIKVNAPASKVWNALTKPEIIKQYLFGTEVISNWKVGSRIIYKGVWEGKPYEDKGIIKKIQPRKLFQSTYLSSMSEKEDKPENYATVTYELKKEYNGTLLTISQDNIDTEEGKKHMKENWEIVLKKLKEVVEH
jgi:uncharacterized protein YndB with AHSA1/START domain